MGKKFIPKAHIVDEMAEENVRTDFFDPQRIKELTMKKIEDGTYLSGGKDAVRVVRPVYRTVLIAAIITVLLAGSALAMYSLGLKDLIMGSREKGVATISLTGWRDTPEYMAGAEWYTWQNEYNATHDIPNREDPGIPVPYQAAGAWSDEMVDALDSILARYNLRLHDEAWVGLMPGHSVIDVSEIIKGNSTFWGGYVNKDGTMKLEGEQILPDGKTASYSLFSAVKGTLTDITSGFDTDTAYEEWTYTAADGTPLCLIMGPANALIVADMDKVFATLSVSLSGRAALEEFADSVVWSKLNACEGFTDEEYAAYRDWLAGEETETLLADAAHAEIGTVWSLSADFYFNEEYTVRGHSSSESEDGSVWVEWTYTPYGGGGAICVRYERPGEDIRSVFDEKLARSGLKDHMIVFEDVPVYDRFAETWEEVTVPVGSRDCTVYAERTADGSAAALWLDEDKNLIFTVRADPGRLSEEQLNHEIEFLLSGRIPYSSEPVALPADEAAE